MARKNDNTSTPVPASRRVNAVSRCGCGRMVQEGSAHACHVVSTEDFDNPVMRDGRNPYAK